MRDRRRTLPHWRRPGEGRGLPPPFIDPLASIVANQGGTILTDDSGNIFDDTDPCKCCNTCPCPDPACLPRCIPRTFQAVVSIGVCDCTQLFVYPPTDAYQKAVGDPTGTYCLRAEGDYTDPFVGGSRCGFWSTPARGSAVAAYYSTGPCPNPPPLCCDPPTEFSSGTTIYLAPDGSNWDLLIQAFGSFGGLGTRAGGYFFGDSVPSSVWSPEMNTPHVFHNQASCGFIVGGLLDGLVGLGTAGTVLVTPCCGP